MPAWGSPRPRALASAGDRPSVGECSIWALSLYHHQPPSPSMSWSSSGAYHVPSLPCLAPSGGFGGSGGAPAPGAGPDVNRGAGSLDSGTGTALTPTGAGGCRTEAGAGIFGFSPISVPRVSVSVFVEFVPSGDDVVVFFSSCLLDLP